MPYFGTITLEFGPSPQIVSHPGDTVKAFDLETDRIPAYPTTQNLPLTPPLISSTGNANGGHGGVAAAAAAMESIPGYEAVDLPDYLEGQWPTSSTAASLWMSGAEQQVTTSNASHINGVGNGNGNGNDIADDIEFAGLDMPEVTLEWDQFLFGEELGQDWNADVEIPEEWYTMTTQQGL